MPEESAINVLKPAMDSSKDHGGLCATNANRIKTTPRIVGFDGAKVHFIHHTAHIKDIQPGIRRFGSMMQVDTAITYEFKNALFFFDFKKAQTLRLVGKGVMHVGGTCMRKASNQPLALYNDEGTYINIDVPSEKLDEILAAIVRLSPDVKIIQGSGL